MSDHSMILPLFVLPGVVLYPQVYLPLHVFEPRYRELVKDAASHSGQLGVISYDLTQPGDHDSEDLLVDMGTMGVIENLRALPDGRYDILVRGLSRFQLDDLVPGKSYRQGMVTLIPERPGLDATAAEARLPELQQLFTYLNPDYAQIFTHLRDAWQPDLAFNAIVNNLIAMLQIGFPQTQALLELDSATDRLAQLRQVLDAHLSHSRLIQELIARRETLEKQNPLRN